MNNGLEKERIAQLEMRLRQMGLAYKELWRAAAPIAKLEFDISTGGRTYVLKKDIVRLRNVLLSISELPHE